MKITPKMTLVLIYRPTLDKVLLCKRAKDPYKGKWNGVGGKQNHGETPHDCALRELWEETGIRTHLSHIANLQFTKHSHESPARISIFVGTFDGDTPSTTDNGSELSWFLTEDIINRPITNEELAGDGNLPYLTNYGIEHLRRLQKCTR